MRQVPAPLHPSRDTPAVEAPHPDRSRARTVFWALFAGVFALKLLVAARLGTTHLIDNVGLHL